VTVEGVDVTRLGLDTDELAACVSCGLCLPHCPTYRVSGDEALSPRGRIAAMRAVEAGGTLTEGFLRSIDTCVQCRGCETACPSEVAFGHLMEDTRAAVARAAPRRAWWIRAALGVVVRHRLLLALSSLLALAQRARLVPRRVLTRLAIPALVPLRRPRLTGTGDDVWLFPGCVMDAWQRHVHADVVAVLGAMGQGVALPGEPAGVQRPCCGALHAHAGLRGTAVRLAVRTMHAMPGTAPVLVDSAGCGAAMKDYGRLIGTPEAERFAARVRDVHEWMAEHRDLLPPPARHLGRVAVQDPCHLRHVQHAEEAVRTVLAPYAELVELDDDGLCCGAGGAYAVVQPALAASIRGRKVAAISRADAPIVVSANPGCAVHLSASGLDVRHPVELVNEAIDTGERAGGR
jgi:glycolate oxidase iron-sulfur subunit